MSLTSVWANEKNEAAPSTRCFHTSNSAVRTAISFSDIGKGQFACYESQPKAERSCSMRTKWDKGVWGVVADVEAFNPPGSWWVGCVFCPFYPVMYHGANGWRLVSIPPGRLGWGWVVAWRAVRANMLCVAFYIRVWGGCTVLYVYMPVLGEGEFWRWSALHRIGRLNWWHLAMQNSAVQNMFLNGLSEHGGKCQLSILFARVDRRCPFLESVGLDGSVFVGVGAWTCGQICVGSFPKHFNLRSVMGPWCLF